MLVKRVFDLVIAAVILVLAAPLLLVIAIAVKLQDRGPVFFRQERVGRGGTTFEVLKFRTMRVDAEEQLAKLRADERAQRAAVQDGTRSHGSPASAGCCARRASTSCRSWSTCCAAR